MLEWDGSSGDPDAIVDAARLLPPADHPSARLRRCLDPTRHLQVALEEGSLLDDQRSGGDLPRHPAAGSDLQPAGTLDRPVGLAEDRDVLGDDSRLDGAALLDDDP